MKVFKTLLTITLVLCMFAPLYVNAGYYTPNLVNDPVEITPANVVLDAVIGEDEGWSLPAKLNHDYVKYLYRSSCANDIDMYFAYTEEGLYFAADIDELATTYDGEASGNSFVYSTGFDKNSLEDGKNIVGFNGDVFILALDPMGLYIRNGFIAATDHTIWYCVGASKDDNGDAYGRIYRSRSEGIDGEITDTDGVEIAVDVAENLTNWKFEAFLPWELIISDMENKTFGRASCTVEEICRGGTQFRAAGIYQDAIYDIEQGGAPYPYNRYITCCKNTYDGTAGYRMDGEYIRLFGLDMFISENDIAFTDVDASSWYYNAVKYCYNRKYMNGASETEFNPEQLLTREMFVQVLANLSDADLSAYTEISFDDVKADDWFAPAVEWAYQNGLTSGISETKFGSGQAVTREQLAVFMTRYAKYLTQLTKGEADLSQFNDRDQISDWAESSMSWMVYKGFINGTGNGNLSPKATASRAQMAQIIMNFTNEYGLNLY